MTDHEMRRRLDEAMGWTRIDEHWRGIPPGQDAGYEDVPNPLESDRDAARLRAWCLEQTWCAGVNVHADCLGTRATVHIADEAETDYIESIIPGLEPDPCRRERLALCRAVLQALEVE